MGALLDVRGLTKHFGGLAAVVLVDFELQEGEILGLIGPNGAGKTTIFNMITGFYVPTKGEIYFKGRCIAHPKFSLIEKMRRWKFSSSQNGRGQILRTLQAHEITQRGIARTFQTIRLFKNLTALENVKGGGDH